MPHPELHAVDGVDAGCGVEDFEGDELAGRVVVEDYAGPLFLAFAHGRTGVSFRTIRSVLVSLS